MASTAASARSLVTAAVVAAACLFIFSQVDPSLIFSSSTPAGGDMGAHVWGPAYLRDHLLEQGRITGWAPDWYAGFPYLTFYFPLPALLIVALNSVLPYTVAFKVVSVVGVCLLPLAAYAFGRLMQFRYPTPALLGVATVPFVFDRFHTIYGGNLPATLAGEFSFSIALVFALLFLGVFARGLRTGEGRALAAVLLTLSGLSHLLPTVFALAGAGVLLLLSLDRRRLRFALTSMPVAGLLAGFWLVPFWQRLPYANDMGWEPKRIYLDNLFPFLAKCQSNGQGGCNGDTFPHVQTAHLPIVFVLAAVAVGVAFRRRDRAASAIAILAGVAALTFRFMPEGRLWNARVLPFWFLCVYLLAALAAGEGVRWLAARRRATEVERPRGRWPELATPIGIGLVVISAVALPLGALPDFVPLSTTDRSFVPAWVRWNYQGYEGKDAWPEYRDLMATMGAVGRDHGCGRAHWEYNGDLNRFGTPMALMLLPYWTRGCIDSMEGLYFESSATTPYHFLTAAVASKGASNPQRDLPYSSTTPDIPKAVEKFKLLGVRYYMAFSPEAQAQSDRHPDLVPLATSDSWKVYRVRGSGLVTPLEYEPVVMDGVSHHASEWLEVSAPWFEDSSRHDVLLAGSGPSSWSRVDVALPEEKALPIGTGVSVSPAPKSRLPRVEVSRVREGESSISFDVDRVGVPVLVKASYFPNWRASGADGPWRVTPNLMVVVPTSEHVTLRYGWTPVEVLGWAATAFGVAALVVLRRRGRVEYPEPVASAARAAEGDPEADEADDAAWDAFPDRRPRRTELFDDDGDLADGEARPLRSEDELGVEQVGAEPALFDDRQER